MFSANGMPLRRRIRNPKDFYGGAALMVVAAVAWYASTNLSGLRGVHFGPGTAPRLFAGLLFVAGAAVTITGLVSVGQQIDHYRLRGPLFIGAAVILFAAAIPYFGLPITSFAALLVASAGSPETRWLEAIGWSAILAMFCTLLFISALGLPLPLWPEF